MKTVTSNANLTTNSSDVATLHEICPWPRQLWHTASCLPQPQPKADIQMSSLMIILVHFRGSKETPGIFQVALRSPRRCLGEQVYIWNYLPRPQSHISSRYRCRRVTTPLALTTRSATVGWSGAGDRWWQRLRRPHREKWPPTRTRSNITSSSQIRTSITARMATTISCSSSTRRRSRSFCCSDGRAVRTNIWPSIRRFTRTRGEFCRPVISSIDIRD